MMPTVLSMISSTPSRKQPLCRAVCLGLLCFLVMLLSFKVPVSFANVLGNPDFSQSIGSGTESNWDSTNGAVRVVNASLPNGMNPAPPPVNIPFTPLAAGQGALSLPGNGKFTFQTYNNIKPGDYVIFSILAENDLTSDPGGAGTGKGDLKIEFNRRLGDGSTALIKEVLYSVESSTGGIIAGNAPPGGGYQRFSVAATAPEETAQVVFTIRTTGGEATEHLVVTQANGEVNPAKLTLAASKRNVSPGDVIGINAHFNNASANSYQNVKMRFNIPQGFDYAENSIRVDGHTTEYRDGSLIVNVNSMSPNQEINVTFMAAAASNIQLGKEYSLEATLNGDAIAPDPGGGPDVLYPGKLSDKASLKFFVQGDPVFEQGTIIGKVFNDLNQNTVQDSGEPGIPWIRLYTEQGIGIVTDEYGRYSIPGVSPGRHVVKIDGHSLPEGTKFITEEAYLVKITPGIMGKANFAVLLPPSGIPENFQKELTVMVTQGVDISRPTLDVHMDPEVVKTGIGILEKEPVFTFNNNYGAFIKKWSLEIRDEFGREIWTGFGVGQPPAEVTWSGMTETGLLVKPGIYSYQFKVRDSKRHEDWTPLKFFEVLSKLDPKAQKNYHPEIPPIGDFNLFKDGKQSIPLVAKPLVRVQGKTQPKNEIKIDETSVTVDPDSGMFQKEFFVEPGEHVVHISATTPEGETTSFNKTIKVKDSTFFMVALGEEQLGQNFARGAMETADSDVYRKGFQQDGRLSYFLKGKLKGKFLVKSHYDTSDKRTALFTNLNPNDYYPIYGDNSTRDYQGQETAQRLYMLVEMDRSYAMWGSFKTEFTDTELATYNRTLSGLKINYETVGTTPYGDPHRGFKLFTAKSTHQADHNELVSTGGTLYYTRNRNIIEGSEKIRVEIRDKIQGMSISSFDLKAGTDYEINYEEGRIMLNRPLSSVAATDTLTSTDLLDGNPTYLIVDYEYDSTSSDTTIPNRGIRGYTHFGDHVRIGGTAIEEKRPVTDYSLNGVDVTLKFGRNTKVTAEYAESIGSQMNNSVSYDGGISYAGLSPLTGRHTKERNSAYVIKAQSKPVERLDLSSYVQGVDPSFSDANMRSQEGFKKYGLSSRFKITENLAARYRFDDSGVIEDLMPLDVTGNTAPYHQLRTHTAQIAYDDGQYLAEAEYQRRNLDNIENPLYLSPDLSNQIPFANGLTGKFGYHVNERLLPYVKAQTAIGGKNDYQFGGGVRYEVLQNLFAYLEQMMGPLGDSTYFGFEKQHGKGARSYANLRSIDRGIGDKTLSTAVGNSFALSEKSRVYSEREYSSYLGQNGFADILGYEGRAGDHWDYGGKFERRRLENSEVQYLGVSAAQALARSNAFNTIGGNVAYADGKKLRARSYVEIRADQATPKLGQIVTRNSLEYHLNEDVSFLSYFNLGDTRQISSENNAAAFMEWSTGFAIRPVQLDKLNMLMRYTYLKDLSNDEQFDNSYYNGCQFDSKAHILSTDVAYDVNRYFGLVEKLAFKRSTVQASQGDTVTVAANTFLSANRINFHVTRKWDFALEYRLLWQSAVLESLKHGALVEVDREFYEYVRLGIGYNFTDFSDDLREANSSRSHGPFVRMTGKF